MKHNFFNLTLSLCLCVFLFSCASNSSKEETPRKIAVLGSAEMEIVPNEIYMVFTTSVASLKAHCQLIRIGVCVFLYFSLLKQLFYWGFVEYVSRENL